LNKKVTWDSIHCRRWPCFRAQGGAGGQEELLLAVLFELALGGAVCSTGERMEGETITGTHAQTGAGHQIAFNESLAH
jgi:hypothetical protein